MIELHKSDKLESFDCDSFVKCESCLLVKDDQVALYRKGRSANGLLNLIHTDDVCGTISIHARGGSIYFITFIDDHS